MYFDFEDLHPETPKLTSPLTRLEVVLLTVIFYMGLAILVLVWPHLGFVKAMEAQRLQRIEAQQQAERERQQRFVYAQPRVEVETKIPPKLAAELSDRDRRLRTVERSPDPKNSLPFSRGNSTERIDADTAPKPQESQPQPASAADSSAVPLPDSPLAPLSRADETPRNPSPRDPAAGVLSNAIRNVQRYTRGDALQNVQGSGDFGPAIQFDTKGVEFGPWIRRFIAQVRSNWFVPEAAWALHGHVVLTFNVHRDGSITDLMILHPSAIDAFNSSAFNALKSSNPTLPLPSEFPDERAFFTVTFYFNESPPLQ